MYSPWVRARIGVFNYLVMDKLRAGYYKQADSSREKHAGLP